MRTTTLRYEVEDRIATVTLDRPERLNAFNRTMMRELLAVFDRIDADDAVRAVIVTGAGRAFCAGADLSAGERSFDPKAREAVDEGEDPRDGGGRVALRIYACRKPVIAAINGPAVGVGITMTLPMDLRLAAEDARIGFVFSRRGLVPEACSSWFLPRLVGIQRAAEWIYTGRVFPAREALAAGLVRSLHPRDELLSAARELAAEIAESAPVSVTLSRALLWRMLGADHPMEAHKIDSRLIRWIGATSDCREGVSSFLEKRRPRFTMSPSRDLPPFYPWWEERRFE